MDNEVDDQKRSFNDLINLKRLASKFMASGCLLLWGRFSSSVFSYSCRKMIFSLLVY